MRVYVNDRLAELPLRAEATLGELLDTLWVELPPGHVMTAVAVDDRSYHAAERDLFGRRSVASVERLVITTQSAETFAADKRLQVGSSLSLIADKAQHAALLFRRGDVSAANSLFAALMEELRLVLLLDQEVSRLGGKGRGAPLPVADIEQAARDLLEAQEGKTWLRVAALLEDSLLPVLRSWARLRRAAPASEPAGAAAG